MIKKNDNAPRKYFASANTYRGFISYFDSVFDSKDYEKIYVLKGGPGTGKSSFMRQMSDIFFNKNTYVEQIYCSSDPHSLDGITVTHGNKKIAILDGTSPHERDAKIPGAIDEIVDLGASLDGRWLSQKREDILSLNKQKSDAYKIAYMYLSLAGKSADIICSYYYTRFDKLEAKAKAESLLEEILPDGHSKNGTRLLSSFGRFGEYKIDAFSEENNRIISIGNDGISVGMFLNICYDILKEKKADFIHLPSVLNPSLTEAIYIPNKDIVITLGDGQINASEYCPISPLEREQIRTAGKIHDQALDEAKRWFAIASELHFRLEEIYGEAMNFERNDKIIQEKIPEIANILEISI